jgi:hypothetical protein
MNATRALERRRQVIRIFEDQDWGNLELLDGWDGENLDELRDLLDEDEFQTLVDQLEEDDARVS